MLALVFLLMVAGAEVVVSQRQSPCPQVFTYERNNETDRWYGMIVLRTNEDINGIYVHVFLDKTAMLLGNWFGEATSSDNKEFVIKNPSYKLEAGQPLSIRFFIKYNSGGQIPNLLNIQLNGINVCKTKTRVETTTSPQLHISQIRPTSSSSVSSNNNNYGINNNNNNNRPSSNSRPNTNSRPSVTRPSDVNRPSSVNTNSNSRPVNVRPTNSGNSRPRPSSVDSDYNTGSSSGNSRPRPSTIDSDYNTGISSGNSRPRPSSVDSDYNTGSSSGNSRPRPSTIDSDYNTGSSGSSRPRPSSVDSDYNTGISGSSSVNYFGGNSGTNGYDNRISNNNNNIDYDDMNNFLRNPTVVRRTTTTRYEDTYNMNNQNNNDYFMGDTNQRRPNSRTTTRRYDDDYDSNNYPNNVNTNSDNNNFGNNNSRRRPSIITTTSSYEVNYDEDGIYATRSTTRRYDDNYGNDYNYFGGNSNNDNNNMRIPSSNGNSDTIYSDGIIFSNTQNPGSSSSNNNNGNNYNERDPDYGNTNSYNNRPSSSVTSLSGVNTGNSRPSTGTGNSNSGGFTFVDNYDDESSSNGDFFQGDFVIASINKPSSSARNPVSNTRGSQCGTVNARPNALISHAQGTSPGEWPWHVALYHSKGIELTYTCGATLISEKHIITAAHCVTKPRTTRPINPENLLAYLGKYNLKKFGSEVQDKEISTIYVHPDYNSTNYFNDIAILKIAEPADITNYVRPCCLWEEDTDLESISDRLGTVVGWGFDQNRRLSNELMKAEMPVVSNLKCIYSNRDFFSQFTFEKTYCAGFRNGTTVCNGDSGGGMFFPKAGSRRGETVWQIRGLVSVGVALQGEAICDPSHYAVFTDLAKHLSWIQRIMRK